MSETSPRRASRTWPYDGFLRPLDRGRMCAPDVPAGRTRVPLPAPDDNRRSPTQTNRAFPAIGSADGELKPKNNGEAPESGWAANRLPFRAHTYNPLICFVFPAILRPSAIASAWG